MGRQSLLRLLLDTHAILWWLFDDPALGGEVRRLIELSTTRVMVSSASGWEIATKHRLGKLPEAEDAVLRLPELLRRSDFDVLPVGMDHALEAGRLPGPHRDPFDRMLIAQARIEGVPVATIDPVFSAYGVDVLW